MLLTIIVSLVIIATVVFLMKKGKIADANNNNIPDALEHAAAEVKETVEKVKKTATKRAPKKKKDA